MDSISAVVEEESVMLLDSDQQVLADTPFHQRPSSDIAAVASKNGSSVVEIQPYRDDPDGTQEPLVSTTPKTKWNNPTIYHLLVPFLLFTVAFGGNITPRINIILKLVCREYYAKETELSNPSVTLSENDSIRIFEGDIDEKCQVAEVHAITSTVTMWVGLLTGLLGAVSSPWLGAWSDRIGRRPILIIGVLGPFLADIVVIIAVKWDNLKSYNLYYLSAIFDGSTGSFLLVLAMCHSYAADCTQPGNERAAAFGLFHGVLFVGMAIGPSISSYLISKTGNVLIYFYVGLVLQCLFLAAAFFIIPESLSHSRKLQAQAAHRQQKRLEQHRNSGPLTVWRVLDAINFLKPLKAFWPQDGTKPVIRRNLVILGLMDNLCVGNGMGEMMAVLLYSEFTFHWTSVETGYYVTVIGIARVILLFICLPNVLKFLKRYVESYQKKRGTYITDSKIFGATDVDVFLIRGSAMFGMTAYIGFILTNSPVLFLMCGACGAFSGSLAPGLEATISRHVPRKNTGTILGAAALSHSVARVVAPTVYLSLYSHTVGTFPKTLFFVFFASFSSIFAGTFVIRRNVTGGLMVDGSDVEEDRAAMGTSGAAIEHASSSDFESA